MLVLLSFALVLLATVLLVLGLLNDDGLTLIYISIASSVAAALVLMIALRLNKPKGEQRAAAPRPLPEPEPVPAGEDDEWVAASPAAEKDDWAESAWGGDEDDEVDFPIADYDDLTVAQILPLLPQLYADEIDVVEARERTTKARPSILDKLSELRGDAGDATEAAPAPATAGRAPSGGAGDDWFPIEDYESLSATQLRPLLGELDDDELALVRERELSLGRRPAVLYEIDRRLGTAPEKASSRTSAGGRKATPAKKAGSARKAPAKRSTAKKAATKKAAPAKKSTAKKATAKKAAPAKRSTAKKSTAKKSTAKKSAAKKAPAKKST